MRAERKTRNTAGVLDRERVLNSIVNVLKNTGGLRASLCPQEVYILRNNPVYLKES